MKLSWAQHHINTHRVLLSNYLLNLWRGPKAVGKMIVADVRMSLNLGMLKQAADLLLILRQFFSDYPNPDWHNGRVKGRTKGSLDFLPACVTMKFATLCVDGLGYRACTFVSSVAQK